MDFEGRKQLVCLPKMAYLLLAILSYTTSLINLGTIENRVIILGQPFNILAISIMAADL